MSNLPEPIADRRKYEHEQQNVLCQCEIYETCPDCRGTDRDMSLALLNKSDVESSVHELLQRSTLYHHLISDLADLFDGTLTPSIRSQAFQLVSDFVEQLEARKSK